MKLMVIDGNSIVNRAFFGVRMLTTKDGTPTNAVFGFLNILLRLLEEDSPDGLCVTFDLKAPTFRHLKYDGYKAQRKSMPEELAVQMPILKEVLDAMNIKRYELEGYEADDLIGTIAKKCESAGDECIVVTGDKDSFQLISDTTWVKHIKTRMGQTETMRYDRDAFCEEYGFEPAKMVDLKALMGDSSDNIPGVPGVGEKTALELIRKYGSVDAIYSDLEKLDIRDSVKKKLDAGADSAKMSYELAEIYRDAPIEFTADETIRKAPDNDKLYEIFQWLEFNKLKDRFGLVMPTATDNSKVKVLPDFTEADPDELAGKLDEIIGSGNIAAVSFNDDFSAFSICIDKNVYTLEKASTKDYDKLLAAVLSENVRKASHNVKDIMNRLIGANTSFAGFSFDTALAAYLLDPSANDYDLDKITYKYCDAVMERSEDENGQFSLLSGSDTANLKADAKAISMLVPVLDEKLNDLGMTSLFNEVEMPLCRVLAEMEREGFLVDKNALSTFGKTLSIQIESLEQQIYELAGEQFNINSPKQLGTVLFEKLMLPAPKKTKTGWSTNIDVLEKLQNKHPIIGLIIEYRQLTKLRSTYTDGLLKVIGSDGRIHTSFQMTVTATGRLSSTDPNLQNIPIRSELGGEIRKMFIADEGNVLVDADYSQIELRLLAHISGDETMRNAFLSGEDVHAVTASQVFDVPLDQVTSQQRSRAKAVNFGIVYGISQFSLSQDIGVSVAEAKQYMENYFAKYHGVRDYMKSIVERSKENGYAVTVYGRRRSLPELKSSNFNIRAFGERVALNMPIQGTAADIMKIAMIKVSNRLKRENLKGRLLLQVHDELIVECPECEADRIKQLLVEEMESAAALSIPLTAEAGVGKSWYDAK